MTDQERAKIILAVTKAGCDKRAELNPKYQPLDENSTTGKEVLLSIEAGLVAAGLIPPRVDMYREIAEATPYADGMDDTDWGAAVAKAASERVMWAVRELRRDYMGRIPDEEMMKKWGTLDVSDLDPSKPLPNEQETK